MCRAASMYVTRSAVLIGSTDNHRDIAREHGIGDVKPGHEIKAVPIEIYPDDGDMRRPFSEWELHTDLGRGEWPEWYSEGEAQEACRRKLREWVDTRVKLDVSFTDVTYLPGLPKCKELYCSGCEGLRELPELPECKVLYCRWCTGLRELPELPKCKELNCYGCTGLRELPELPKCKELECDDRLRT